MDEASLKESVKAKDPNDNIVNTENSIVDVKLQTNTLKPNPSGGLQRSKGQSTSIIKPIAVENESKSIENSKIIQVKGAVPGSPIGTQQSADLKSVPINGAFIQPQNSIEDGPQLAPNNYIQLVDVSDFIPVESQKKLIGGVRIY